MSWQLKNKRLQTGPGSLINSTGSTVNTNLHHGTLNSLGSPKSATGSHHLPHPLDGGEDMVRQFAASQIDTQKTAFLRWVNVQLATTTAYGPMSAINRDFRDGKRLIGLLEVVSKEPLKPERGNMRIHQMANVSKALTFIEKKTGEPVGSIGNEDIVDGNVKLTLGLIWIIIYRFQIQNIANTMTEVYPSLAGDMHNMDGEDTTATVKGKKKGASSRNIDAKQALLRWVRLQLEDYVDIIPPIQDFHRSWRTGLAFAALIHRHDPSFLPEFYTNILQAPHETIEQWRTTLTTAFDTALEKMAMPKLLGPEDLVDVETPDERAIMTYVSEYYLVMSKHQQEQDPAVAEELHTRRVEAKEERIAVAGEDQQAALRRIQEEEERKKREEEEELERIRLRRLEIESWSIHAAKRAREEEEARRKRKEEEEEKSLQRKLRREQREREKAMLLQEATGRPRRRSSVSGASAAAIAIIAESELGTLAAIPEPMDPEELQERQAALDEKLGFYLEQANKLLDWIQRQEDNFPETPDTNAPLDRTRDLDPFKLAVEQTENARKIKEKKLTSLHVTREELLDYESPELTADQITVVDKAWWDVDASWAALGKRTTDAKTTIQELQWIVECSQEIDRILGDVQRFEEQLLAMADKRSHDSLKDRSQISVLDHQDTNLLSIHMLLKKYSETLSTLLESNTHTPPEHLSNRNTEVLTERLPRLDSTLDVAHKNLANDRLLRVFLGTLSLAEEWIGRSGEWLAGLGVQRFVSEDVWYSGDTVKDYLARDQSCDADLDLFQTSMDELKTKLEQEKVKLNEFRSNGLAKLEQDAQAVIQSMEETHDATAQATSKEVQDMLQETTHDLEKVGDKLPKEVERCTYARRVLDYLISVRTTLALLESAFNAVNDWIMTQPETDVEEQVSKVEASLAQLESTFKAEDEQPVIWESIQFRHAGLTNLVKDLRSCFSDKLDILRSDQQTKEFLELTQACKFTLRELRSQLYADSPFKGFTSEDTTPFDDFSSMVSSVGKSFDAFEQNEYAKYQEVAALITVSSNAPGSRQDPVLVQDKVAYVQRLHADIKALRSDRERDLITLAECRRVASQLLTLNQDWRTLESKLSAFDVTDPEQKGTLNGLMDNSSQLANDFMLIEQSSIFRYITRDPSCTGLLKEIRDHQHNVSQLQTRLQSGLEVGEQWSILWDQFQDRVEALQQYLDQTEQEILKRGIANIDGLADGEENWKKTEDELQDAEEANNSTQTSLKEFQRQRMLELSNLKVALHQSVQVSDGIENLDQIRTEQYQEAEQHQQRLREHFQRLYLLNNREGFQLEILGQRLVWSQQLAESKKEVTSSISACQGIAEEYTRLLAKCSENNSTAELNSKTAEQLKQQMDHIATKAAAQKEAKLDVALAIYDSIKELATIPAPGETESAEPKKIPLHLEVELHEFKNQYSLLDHHLEYASQMTDHSAEASSFVRKIDAMDSGFLRLATEFKAEKEANPKSIEKLNAIRVELEDLTEEQRTIVKMPKLADKVADVYTASQVSGRADLERVLKMRLERSGELNKALDPLITEFKALLAYQDGLRKLSQELSEHDRWVNRSGQVVQSTHDQIKQMFTSWPGDEFEQRKGNAHEAMVVFDVHEQVVVDDLDVLMAEMDKEFAHVQDQKKGYMQTKVKVEEALLGATVHSKQLQLELEWFVDHLANKIQKLEADIRMRSLQLQALEKRAVWEKEIEVSRSWFKDFAKAVILFAREQSKWKSNHRELDDASSMRSFRTTASRMQVDRLGLSVIEFEEQVEIFETESRPRVDKAWSELCSALAFIARSIPDEFQRRQTALGREFEEIRKQVGYSAHIVTQRRSLEDVAFRLEEIEGYKHELAANEMSTKNGQYAAVEPVHVKTKGKKWSRFQAKVKKLTRK